jgi:hypothetical protein
MPCTRRALGVTSENWWALGWYQCFIFSANFCNLVIIICQWIFSVVRTDAIEYIQINENGMV